MNLIQADTIVENGVIEEKKVSPFSTKKQKKLLEY
jgi:hypothetical protein